MLRAATTANTRAVITHVVSNIFREHKLTAEAQEVLSDVVDDISDSIFAEDSEDDQNTPQKKQRRRWKLQEPRKKKDFANSKIQQHLREGLYDGIKGEDQFRARYRLPKSAYLELREAVLEADSQLDAKNPINPHQNIPIDNKLLTVLRVLGRGMSTKDDEDHSDMHPDTIRRVLRRTCRTISREIFSAYVHPPRNEEEAKKICGMYTEAGFPGCIGSMDVVHVAWDRFPAALFHLHKGRYSFPTLAFECTVANDRSFLACTDARHGAHNDKTIVRTDKFVNALRSGAFADVEYDLYSAQGQPRRVRNPYLLVDGGYHLWRHLQCGYKHTGDFIKAKYSDQLASVRKDVECAFGILKKRFRILKIPLQLAN